MLPVTRARRYGRALRRLLDGKTSTVVWHIAQRLEADGYIVANSIDGESSYQCVLTDKGRAAALEAKCGRNPYATQAPKRPLPQHFAPRSAVR